MASALDVKLTADTAQFQSDLGKAAAVAEREMARTARATQFANLVIKEMAKNQRDAGQAAEGIKASSHEMEGLSFATAGAKRELLVLTHELSQGNFSRFGGSLLVLGERTGAASLLFSGMGLAVLGAVGALGAFAYAAIKGAEESQRLANALVVSGNYAGLTAGQFDALAVAISSKSTLAIAKVREGLEGLVATGEIGPRVIGPAALAMANLERLTGEKTENIVKDFAKMGDGVAKWALEHNKAYNFLTGDQYAYIKRLEETGQQEAAAVETLRILNDHVQTSATFWDKLKKATGDAWDEMVGNGRGETVEDRLAAVNKRLADMYATAAARRNLPAFSSAPEGQAGDTIASAQADREAINRELLRKTEVALGKAEADRIEKTRIAAIEARDRWREETKGISLVNKELEKYRTLTVEPLKGTANEIGAAEQAATEAAIRKRYNPAGARTDNRLEESIAARLRALGDEDAKLKEEIRQFDLYGKAVNDAARARLEFDLAHGRLKGASPSDVAKLRANADSVDADAEALRQRKVNAEVDKSIALLREEASAKQANARDTEVATRLAEMEAKGIKVGTEAYIENAASIRLWVGIKHDAILARTLAAQQLANDDEVAKLDAQTNSLGLGSLALQQAAASSKLWSQAQRDIAANPGQVAEILDAYVTNLDRLTAAQRRNYEGRRSFDTGVATSLNKYQEAATDAAAFTEKFIDGSLSNLENAVVAFTETGKLHLGSLFQFMADEFIRQQARMLVAAATSSASGGSGWIGAIGSIASAFFGGSTELTTSGYSASGFATGTNPNYGNEGGIHLAAGTNYVPYNGMRATLHEGEAVVPKAFNPAAGAGRAVTLNVINNGQPVQARQSQQETSQGTIVTLVLDAVAHDIASGGKSHDAIQQRFGLNPGGSTPRH